MYTAALILEIIVSACMVTCIMLQSQGSGLGSSWGGGGETFHTRRGLEKVIFTATIVLGVVFIGNSIALLMLR